MFGFSLPIVSPTEGATAMIVWDPTPEQGEPADVSVWEFFRRLVALLARALRIRRARRAGNDV